MKRALCIWLPEWPIQRLVVARPELKSKPLVLHARDPRRGRLVVANCARARQLGVVTGMPLAEAAALQKKISLYEHESILDREALSELAIWCEQFSPIVGLENTDTPSCLVLDVTGLAPIFGSESRLIELINQAFSQRGYHVRVGLANTVGAAWALAHYGEPDNTEEDLGSLPIEALRLSAETMATLHQLGVESISQLLQLPRHGMATRLGETVIKRIDQAFGQHPEVIVAHRPSPKFEAEWVLEHPTERRDVIDTILQKLTEQVTQVLAQNGHAIVQAEATLRGQRSSCNFTISLFRPSSNPKHIYDLLQLQLESFQMREPIQSVRLTAVTTVRITGEQHVLWDEVGQGRDRDIAQLVDRLSSRLGKDCVFGVQAQAGALPERAYRRKPLANTMNWLSRSKRRRAPTATATANSLKSPHRPLWLYDPPQPLRMTSLVATGIHPPAVFQFQDKQYHVVRHWGPERIETGWWRGRSVLRDYYRVETESGHRFWLFRQLDDGDWFLHGCFE